MRGKPQRISWFALADVATDLEASRLLYRQAAERLGTPEGPVAVAHAKRFCPDAALQAAIACSEVLGAYGWLLDHPLARQMLGEGLARRALAGEGHHIRRPGHGAGVSRARHRRARRLASVGAPVGLVGRDDSTQLLAEH